MLQGVAQHELYHAGQIALLKKAAEPISSECESFWAFPSAHETATILRSSCEALEPFLSNESPINVAVVGVGAFGRNHARVYRQLEQAGRVRLVGVVDPDTARADAAAREFDCKAFGSIEQCLTTHSEVQAASVAVPTVLHLDVARG